MAFLQALVKATTDDGRNGSPLVDVGSTYYCESLETRFRKVKYMSYEATIARRSRAGGRRSG